MKIFFSWFFSILHIAAFIFLVGKFTAPLFQFISILCIVAFISFSVNPLLQDIHSVGVCIDNACVWWTLTPYFFSVCLSPLYKSFISACSQFPYEIIVHFQVGWSLQFWSILKNLKILLKLELKIPWNLYNFKVSIYFLVKNWFVLMERLFPMKFLFLVI